MNSKMNGMKVNAFRVRDTGGNPHDITIGYSNIMGARPDCGITTDIYFSATYHGDRDEFWIVQVLTTGEVRHNARMVECFELEDTPS